MPAIDSDPVNINSITLKEQGSNPAAAPAGKWRLFTKSDGLYLIDDGGAVSHLAREQYILLRDEKPQNTDSGTFTTGAWRTRDLNTEVVDEGNAASLAANQITLQAGTYRCHILVPAWAVRYHQARLYNVTDGAVLALGTSAFVSDGSPDSNHSIIIGYFILAAAKVLEVQHSCTQSYSNQGFGIKANLSTEIFTVAEFWRIP